MERVKVRSTYVARKTHATWRICFPQCVTLAASFIFMVRIATSARLPRPPPPATYEGGAFWVRNKVIHSVQAAVSCEQILWEMSFDFISSLPPQIWKQIRLLILMPLALFLILYTLAAASYNTHWILHLRTILQLTMFEDLPCDTFKRNE